MAKLDFGPNEQFAEYVNCTGRPNRKTNGRCHLKFIWPILKSKPKSFAHLSISISQPRSSPTVFSHLTIDSSTHFSLLTQSDLAFSGPLTDIFLNSGTSQFIDCKQSCQTWSCDQLSTDSSNCTPLSDDLHPPVLEAFYIHQTACFFLFVLIICPNRS